MVGPALSDNSWQAKGGKGFDVAHFQLDWQTETATSPEGQSSSRWSLAGERREVVFFRETCAACPVRQDCTKSSTTGRVLHVRPQAADFALQARRQAQETPAFRQASQTRAGIEATLSQAVRGMGIRRARYDGLHKTHLQQVVTAVAINLVRIDAVLTQTPRGKTRQSNFMRLLLPLCLQGQTAALFPCDLHFHSPAESKCGRVNFRDGLFACWLNLQEGWWRLFRRDALTEQSFANPNEIKQATTVVTTQPNL